MTKTLVIERRFCRPVGSGNGGYVCGSLAKHIDGPATVRLSPPPPLNKQLRIETDDGLVALRDGDTIVGEARPDPIDLEIPEPPSFEEAEVAHAEYLKHVDQHPLPNCFVCGPLQDEHGLRIFPGVIEERDLAASPGSPTNCCLRSRSGSWRSSSTGPCSTAPAPSPTGSWSATSSCLAR